MPKYRYEIEIFEGNGGQLRKENGVIVTPAFAREGLCSWMYRGDGDASYQAGRRFCYPEDIGKMCPWLVDAIQPFLRVMMYGGTLGWKNEGTPYEKVIDPEGITTEYVRCPDPTASGIVVKIIRTRENS
jgi:uncharacterized repeat protein (TIGR04076 family)